MKMYSNKEVINNLLSTDPKKFFDLYPTLSHLFRFRHPALKQRSYGEMFCKRLIDQKILNNRVETVVEIGGGLGDFAYGFLSWFKLEQQNDLKLNNIKYIIITDNKILQRIQQEKLAEFSNIEFLFCDGKILPFETNQIKGLIIINEELSRYPSAEFTETEWKESQNPAILQIKKGALPVPTSIREETIWKEWEKSQDPIILQIRKAATRTEYPVLLNLGVAELMLEVIRCLGIGYDCIIVNSGSMDKPKLLKSENNDKIVSFSFLDLLMLGNCLKLRCDKGNFMPLVDFLEFRKDIRMANISDARALSNGDPLAGWQIYATPLSEVKTKYTSYGKDFEKLGTRILEALKFPSIYEEGFPDEKLSCKDIKILIFHKSGDYLYDSPLSSIRNVM